MSEDEVEILRRNYNELIAVTDEALALIRKLEGESLSAARLKLAADVEADDSQTYCPCCEQRVRNDQKGMTRWQAEALVLMVEWDVAHPGEPFHAGTLLKNTDGARDHGAALLRHWGAITEAQRPANAPKTQKGSRGFSGFYVVTDEAYRIVNGGLFHKNIKKPFGSAGWTLFGPLVDIDDVRVAEEVTDECNRVVDGTTVIAGVHEEVEA